MKKQLLILLALVALLCGCPSNAPQVDASDFAPATTVDAQVDAAPVPHRLGSFNPTCTGTGLPKIVSGVQTSACATIVNADVSGSAAIAGTKISPDFGAQTIATTGVVTSSQYRGTGGGAFFVPNPGVSAFVLVVDNNINAGAPIIGYATIGSPYSVHGDVTDATVGTFALSAASYSPDIIRLTGGTAGTVTFPAPAANGAYYKTIINTSGVVKTLTTGSGTTQAFGSGNTVRCLFDTTGVHLVAAATAYP